MKSKKYSYDRRRKRPPEQGCSRIKAFELGAHSGPLRLVAFSDYRVQDIELLIEKLSKLQPRPDLILYAGDDIERFRPAGGKNLFEAIASHARYGLCAIAGNDDEPSVRRLVSGKSVLNVHLFPARLGSYAILGLDGAPRRPDLEGIGYILHSEQEIAKHLSFQRRTVGSAQLIVLSHAPPEGILDHAVRFSPNRKPRSIGSRALRKFMEIRKEVVLVVCGHVHRCGGMHRKLGRTLVVNAANHDDPKAVARFAVIDMGVRGTCKIEWQRIRETSVIPGIGPPTAERLRNIGVRTVEEFASAPLDRIGRVPFLGHNPEILQARAQAMVQNKAILLRAPELPSGPELFLDIETYRWTPGVWLIGACAGRHGEYRAFFAQTPENEKRILLDFLDFVRCYPGASILTCSGSNFEERNLRERLSYYGLATSGCARIIDLHWVIQRSVALPTQSYRVKEIGEFFGYRYKHPDLDGFTVASLYEGRYQALRKTPAGRKLAQRLIAYNEDDVRCLPYILNAIKALGNQVFVNQPPGPRTVGVETP